MAVFAVSMATALPQAAQSSTQGCAQLNDRVVGSDGMGGIGARFRELKTKIAEETRLGQTAAAARDRVELSGLAANILEIAKSMESNGCELRVVQQASVKRSIHGCVGFDGVWQTPTGAMRLRNGSAIHGATTLKGSVSGNVLRGTWDNPMLADEHFRRGKFAFTLAADGDSFTTVWTTADGVSGSYDTDRCIGP